MLNKIVIGVLIVFAPLGMYFAYDNAYGTTQEVIVCQFNKIVTIYTFMYKKADHSLTGCIIDHPAVQQRAEVKSPSRAAEYRQLVGQMSTDSCQLRK